MDIVIWNVDLELLNVELGMAEKEILGTKSQEFIDGYDTCKDMVCEFLAAHDELPNKEVTNG